MNFNGYTIFLGEIRGLPDDFCPYRGYSLGNGICYSMEYLLPAGRGTTLAFLVASGVIELEGMKSDRIRDHHCQDWLRGEMKIELKGQAC